MAKDKATQVVASEVILELMLEVISTFFLLQAAGKRIGAVTISNGGYWGMLRSLKLQGPQTVPQIARSRPVSRQHIQKLANTMIAEGVIELVDNPAHRRSKLLRLTSKGETAFQEISKRIAQASAELAQGMDAVELQLSVQVLQQVGEKLKRTLK
jgi:DNA-binding MarR family transcriptional regulator